VPARLVAAALAPERLDGVPALYADGHGGGIVGCGIISWVLVRGGADRVVLRTRVS
jgi:hypothetical protein